MRIDEIKPGMVFVDNDKRSDGRRIRILRVSGELIEFASCDRFGNVSGAARPLQSWKPARFHKEKRSAGFSLVSSQVDQKTQKGGGT
jgi:hypothetical protein